MASAVVPLMHKLNKKNVNQTERVYIGAQRVLIDINCLYMVLCCCDCRN